MTTVAGPSQWSGRSWGQPDPGDAGEGGKQPRQRRDAPVLPDGAGPASKARRRTRGTSVQNPVSVVPARTWRIWAGVQCAAAPSLGGRLRSPSSRRGGGRAEGLRRRRGEAAGVKLGAYLADRHAGNVGTAPRRSRCPGSARACGIGASPAEGAGRGGGPVVVRARERRAHGEGGQQVCSGRTGRPGGRW